jgi:LmbE family N-acetylglucosaminyl deacetylase
MLLAQQAKVQVLVLTKGELGQAHLQDKLQSGAHEDESQALAHVRVQESMAAAQVLGLPEPQFLDFNDRHLAFTETVTQAIAAQMKVQPIDLLLLPSLSDPHPDHQATALAGLAAVRNAIYQDQANGQTAHSIPRRHAVWNLQMTVCAVFCRLEIYDEHQNFKKKLSFNTLFYLFT